MFGYEERDSRSSLTDYLYEEISVEALMLYALLEFHDYSRKYDTYSTGRNRVMRLPDSAGDKKEEE